MYKGISLSLKKEKILALPLRVRKALLGCEWVSSLSGSRAAWGCVARPQGRPSFLGPEQRPPCSPRAQSTHSCPFSFRLEPVTKKGQGGLGAARAQGKRRAPIQPDVATQQQLAVGPSAPQTSPPRKQEAPQVGEAGSREGPWAAWRRSPRPQGLGAQGSRAMLPRL